MALGTNAKLGIAAGVLGLLVVGLVLRAGGAGEARRSHTAEGRLASMPKLGLTPEAMKGIDRLELTKPAVTEGEHPVPASKIVLVKEGETWKVTEPLAVAANQANVSSLLSNLAALEVTELIQAGTEGYAKYGVGDDKALHVVASQGDKAVADLAFGDGGSRGQMTRIAGQDGVYVVKGYSKYVVDRDLNGWRDKVILKFDEAKAKGVELENEHGRFAFAKADGKWTGKFGKQAASAALPKFEASKVEDLLRAYKTLNAVGFAEGKTLADAGLDKPQAKLTIVLEDGTENVLFVGGTSEGTNRWMKTGASDEIFNVSSWVAEWATAAPEKFESKASPKPGQGEGLGEGEEH